MGVALKTMRLVKYFDQQSCYKNYFTFGNNISLSSMLVLFGEFFHNKNYRLQRDLNLKTNMLTIRPPSETQLKYLTLDIFNYVNIG